VVPVLLTAVVVTCMAQPPQLANEVGRRSLPWMPPDLARQVVRHERDFQRGVAAVASWPAAYHEMEGPSGLTVTIPAQCERLVRALENRAPFSEIVAGLGVLAHLTLDASSPFSGSSGAEALARSFGSYLHSRRDRIPVVFYGQEWQLIKGPADGIDRLLAQRRREMAPLVPIVREDIDRFGGPAAWGVIDDRSSTFGAASIILNHAATDLANLASWIWYHGGGLVPTIPQPPQSILVWRGEPRPRETPRTRLGFRQAAP
jgi:hypothetical protein